MKRLQLGRYFFYLSKAPFLFTEWKPQFGKDSAKIYMCWRKYELGFSWLAAGQPSFKFRLPFWPYAARQMDKTEAVLPLKYKPISSRRFWRLTFWNFTLDGMSYNAQRYLGDYVIWGLERLAWMAALIIYLPVWIPVSLFNMIVGTKRRWLHIISETQRAELVKKDKGNDVGGVTE